MNRVCPTCGHDLLDPDAERVTVEEARDNPDLIFSLVFCSESCLSKYETVKGWS